MFKSTSEHEITDAIVSTFAEDMKQFTNTDAIIIGGGPSGLMAARELAQNDVKTLVIERNNYLGGGFWIGGYLMNTITIRPPGQEILSELSIPYTKYSENLYITSGPHACSKLIAATCDAGVKFLNMTSFEDVIFKDQKVKGVVVNWTPVSNLPRQITCVDPIALEAKIVIDATGHDAVVVKKLEEKKILDKLPGHGSMWVEKSEELVVANTGMVHPGLIVVGMAVSTTYGLPRMGPTFGAMLFSGKNGGLLALEQLKQTELTI
ncbi:MAG: sulfide-dependent adenosine diphosphate thiazole synthase [Candidatus Thermoplasmatota archaeon]|nr:sulfide-dependent adenosine diphosphate thiazole synthase [Candidatus Thermoplasmatota archaeon]MBU1940895.1 sulfide-dependent adenosine diphosphate thiazole synthase [Candidatus Thermoplasmatota archaeon]